DGAGGGGEEALAHVAEAIEEQGLLVVGHRDRRLAREDVGELGPLALPLVDPVERGERRRLLAAELERLAVAARGVLEVAQSVLLDAREPPAVVAAPPPAAKTVHR